MTRFLATHRVLHVERRFVELGAESFWALCVDYLCDPNGTNTPSVDRASRNRIDYKSVLNPTQFRLFAALRELRKELAAEDGIPVYAIFTNEQLAQFVQRNVRNRSELKKIDGLGDARVEKYADRLLSCLSEQTEKADAKDGEFI